MIGLTFDKIVVIAIIAGFIIGPQRLPEFAATAARMVKKVRHLAYDARDRVKDEMGDSFDEVDWKKLDPRQYDPRQIIREALFEDMPEDSDGRRSNPPTVRPSPKSTPE